MGGEVLPEPAAAAAAKSLQSCLTLYDPIDGSPPGSPVPGILQARTLEDPIDGSPPGSPVPGILQVRTLDGLPFPSPMHESEK